MSDTQPKRPRGRPAKPVLERKRNILSMRVRDDMRAELARRAAAHQRSVSEEAEAILESVLQSGTLLDQALVLAFGSQITGLALLLARVARETRVRLSFAKRPPVEPLSEAFIFDQMVRAITRALEAIRPTGEIKQPKVIADLRKAGHHRAAHVEENIGEAYAVGVLCAVANDPKSQPWLLEATAPIRDKLGPESSHTVTLPSPALTSMRASSRRAAGNSQPIDEASARLPATHPIRRPGLFKRMFGRAG
jgi:plasmid stability protein